MKLLGFLIVVAIAIAVYVWAKPHYETMYHQGKTDLPPKVTINVPNPDMG